MNHFLSAGKSENADLKTAGLLASNPGTLSFFVLSAYSRVSTALKRFVSDEYDRTKGFVKSSGRKSWNMEVLVEAVTAWWLSSAGELTPLELAPPHHFLYVFNLSYISPSFERP